MSEYIPRLREELVAAAAREAAGVRRRPRVRPRRVALVLAAAAIAAALVVAAGTIEIASDERPVVSPPAGAALAYDISAFPGDDVAAAGEESAQVLRARLAAAGLRDARVSVSGDRMAVEAGPGQAAAVAALSVPGRLWIADFEAGVLGPDGRPAPQDASATGGGVSRYEAVVRAAEAPEASGPPALWLLDDATREVLAGPELARAALGSVPAGARIVEVPADVHVVRAPPEAAGRWYAIRGAAVGNAQVASARAASDPRTREPVVAIALDEQGRAAFHALTRDVARRGAEQARPGEDPIAAAQHLAIVLDDQLVSVPFINHEVTPDGIDGRQGLQIEGGLTPERARQLAAILDSGPMPAALEPAP